MRTVGELSGVRGGSWSPSQDACHAAVRTRWGGSAVAGGEVEPTVRARRRRPRRVFPIGASLLVTLGTLFGVPYWTLVLAGADWPTPYVIAGTVLLVGALVVFAPLMVFGHGRGRDRA